MSSPSRSRLALPEADDIAALLADVIAPAPVAAPTPPPSNGNGNGRPPLADPSKSAADFWGAVNWGNDPGFAAPPAAKPAASRPPSWAAVDLTPRAARLSDLPAGSFFGAVNWNNDPAKTAAVQLLLDPDALPDPWAAGSYLTTGFVWD